MNRREFMDSLERLLSDVPLEDRIDALQYYEDYFEDAGIEKEQDVIKELGSPQTVADIIKRDLGIERGEGSKYKDYRFEQGENAARQEQNVNQYRTAQGGSNHAWQSNNGTQGNYHAWNQQGDTRTDENGWTQNYSQNNQYNEYAQNSGKIDRRLLIIIFILTLPITIGPFIGIFAGVFGLAIGFFAAAFGLIIGGVATFGTGIGAFVTGMFADGLLLMGVGLLLTLVCSLICRVIIPVLINGCRKLFAWLFRGEGLAA